jgi:preprotein translocase subunit YajC
LFNFIKAAYAEGEGAAPALGGGGWDMFIMIGVMILIFYFLLIRPNQKKEKERKQMIDNLQKGDKVLTSGGIYGVVVNVKNEEGIVVLKIGEGAKVEFAKAAIQTKIS